MLNNIYSITGIVVEGEKIARQMGYPTMNLDLPDDFSLSFGIYAGFMEYQGNRYPGVISIGITPHFEVKKPKLEIHVFDFEQNLYGEMIKVTISHYLREEMKFDSLELLIVQIGEDCLMAKALASVC